MLLESELVLHVIGEEVHFQRGAQIDFPPQRIERGRGAAGHVVHEAAPAKRRPVVNGQAGDAAGAAIAADELAQGLRGVEQPFAAGGSRVDAAGPDHQGVVLRRGAVAKTDRWRPPTCRRQSGERHGPFLPRRGPPARAARAPQLAADQPAQQLGLRGRRFQHQLLRERKLPGWSSICLGNGTRRRSATPAAPAISAASTITTTAINRRDFMAAVLKACSLILLSLGRRSYSLGRHPGLSWASPQIPFN